MKFLSYIIPVYNVEKYLEECIESLYKQDLTDEEFEVIAIDDGSTDNSLKILQELAHKHQNLNIISQPNSGPSIARNNGINAATGKYIMFIDADDILIPHTIKHILDVAKKENTDIVRGNLIKLNNDEIKQHVYTPPTQTPVYECMDGRDGFLNCYDPNACYPVINCFRRDFLIANEIFYPKGMFFEDVVFTTKAYVLAKKIAKIDLTFYIYRQQSMSTMANIDERKLKDLVKAARINIDLLPLIKHDKQCSTRLKDAVFCSLNVVIWYLTHHRSAYLLRNNIIQFIKQEFPTLNFHNTAKQSLLCMAIKRFPMVYLTTAYCLAKKKYA